MCFFKLLIENYIIKPTPPKIKFNKTYSECNKISMQLLCDTNIFHTNIFINNYRK